MTVIRCLMGCVRRSAAVGRIWEERGRIAAEGVWWVARAIKHRGMAGWFTTVCVIVAQCAPGEDRQDFDLYEYIRKQKRGHVQPPPPTTTATCAEVDSSGLMPCSPNPKKRKRNPDASAEAPLALEPAMPLYVPPLP